MADSPPSRGIGARSGLAAETGTGRGVRADRAADGSPPRWVKVSGIAAVVIAVAFIAIFGI
jgi:hypothetical protein